jgi:hypothetical protein
MVIDEWPIRSCTVFPGNSKPPSLRRLMHHEAKKSRSACKPVYLAFPSTVMPALTCIGAKPRKQDVGVRLDLAGRVRES